MSKTHTTIPVKRHIAKFLQQQADGSGTINMLKTVGVLKTKNGHSYKQYLSRRSDKVEVRVLMHRPSLRNKYALVRKWESDFRDQLHLFVEVHWLMQLTAMEGIRRFLDHYQITEDELSVDTAYKSWQRYKEQKEKKRINRPPQAAA